MLELRLKQLLHYKTDLDHRFGQTRGTGRSRQGVFGSPASCLSDSEFLPGWKKCPGVTKTMIKAVKQIEGAAWIELSDLEDSNVPFTRGRPTRFSKPSRSLEMSMADYFENRAFR
jgi:hypothetical protein